MEFRPYIYPWHFPLFVFVVTNLVRQLEMDRITPSDIGRVQAIFKERFYSFCSDTDLVKLK